MSVMRRGMGGRAGKAMCRNAWRNEGKRGRPQCGGWRRAVSGKQNRIQGGSGVGCGGGGVLKMHIIGLWCLEWKS